MIEKHTGVNQVYTPALDDQVRATVDGLLADGLTVDEAIRVAFLNNRAFQALFYGIGVSRAEVVQSGLLTNPTASFGARLPTPSGLANVTFGFAQEMADLWRIPVRKRIAKANLEQTVLKVVEAAVDLRAKTRAAYYRVVALDAAEASAQESLKLVEASLGTAQRRFDAGEATLLDVNLIRADVLDVRGQLAEIRKDGAVAHAAFARVLGIGGGEAPSSIAPGSADAVTRPRLTDPLPGPGAAIPDDEALIACAAKNRLDIQRAAREVNAAEDELIKEFRTILPNLSVGIDGERPERISGSATATGTKPASTGDAIRQRIRAETAPVSTSADAVTLLLGPALQITLPLWDQNQAQIAKARFALRQKTKEYEDLVEALVEDVRTSAAEMRRAEERLNLIAGEALPQAERNVDMARRAYEAGLESILVLTEAQRNVVRQRGAFAAAQGDYAVACAELERASGGQLPVNGPGHE